MTAGEELDAAGAYVLPGGIDLHVHLMASAPQPDDPPGWVDDFHTGTAAALAGGITTVGQMSFPDEDDGSVRAAVDRDLAAAQQQAVSDFVLHPSAFLATTDTPAQLRSLAAEGHRSLKIVTIALDHDPRPVIEAVRTAAQLDMLVYVHCEDGVLIEHVTDTLTASGHGQLCHYPASRPDYTEAAAVERAIAICEATGAAMVLVHLSSAAALDAARRARRRGLPVFVETRPLYLHLTADVHAEPDGGKYVGMPPLRTAADRDALWAGMADGSVHTVASDHAPWLLADKIDAALDLNTIRAGVADLETMLPMIFDEGVRTGRISLEQFVALTSTNTARLNGMYPRKGTIAVGSDADLLVLDPERTWTIDGVRMQSRAGYSVYDGMNVTGAVRYTVSRGDVVYGDGAVLAEPGRGRLAVREGGGRL
jgi:dihydropyrimidinase